MVVVVGPTGAGKTELAMRLAKGCNGEIVSADSQQVYRGMDIGTAKVGAAEREDVPHHIVDVLQPTEEMTAQGFVDLADKAIEEIGKKAKSVIIAGGTMLYVRALLYGLFPGPPKDEAVRKRLAEVAEEHGVEALWEKLRSVDCESAERIYKQDLRRITRALEVFELTKIPLSEHHRRHQESRSPRYRALWVGVAPERDELYRRINARVDKMMAAGFLDEVKGLREAGVTPEMRSQSAIGYRELHQVLDETISSDEAVEKIKRNSRRYARRQLSWYRQADNIAWHDEGHLVDLGTVERYLAGSQL